MPISNKQQTPLISVIIASYNHELFIEETISSIWNQAYKNIEIIVVDDCSTDGSWDALKKLKLMSDMPMQVFRNTSNLGPSATLNRALFQASGEFIAFIASDDLFANERFNRSIDLFNSSQDLLAVYANGRTYEAGNIGQLIHKQKAQQLLEKKPKEICRYLYTNSSPLFLQAALFKRSIIESVGGFDDSNLADDWLLNARLFCEFTSKTQYAYIPDVVVFYRQHAENLHKQYHRQEQLKIEFIGKNTPEELKSEGYSNVYYWAALQRLKRDEISISWHYYKKSQSSKFYFKRLQYIAKMIKKLFNMTLR